MSPFISRLTWEENRELVRDAPAVLVPVGSTEQHGPHLPVDNDAFCAEALARRIAEEAGRRGRIVAVSPPVAFGVSEHHMGFPGTIALRPRVFEDMVYDIGASLLRHGWRAVVFVNGHGGNSSALASAAERLAHSFPEALVLVHEWWQLLGDRLREILEDSLCHGCEGETSLSLALGQRVLGDKARREMPPLASKFFAVNMLAPRLKIGFPLPPMNRLTRSGVIGDPTKATVDKGEAIVREVVSRTILLIDEIAAGNPLAAGDTQQSAGQGGENE
ncbi:MAG: creatininase family protein [Firmicutes bacterium]|nr:creatininase family protein [Bacillota bacterium]